MPKINASDIQYNLYVDLMHTLNQVGGQMYAISPEYYDFLDRNKTSHNKVMRSLAVLKFDRRLDGYHYQVVHRTEKIMGSKDGAFFLTNMEGRQFFFDLDESLLPQPVYVPPSPEELELQRIVQERQEERRRQAEEEEKRKKEEEERNKTRWTKDRAVTLLTREVHLVGRMLGTGYDLLTDMHGEWARQWIVNPTGFSVMVHQAHRGSYKSSLLRLCIAILMILQPTLIIILIRKSEDAVKELINGVSKILDTPLFHEFVRILHPDIMQKGGFKKTTDTALAIDTNLNTSLSGEFQLRGVGLGSPLTGKHAKMIITDDIVTLDDRESEAERRNTIVKYQELINIISSGKGFQGSVILNIGTPWHEEDAFSIMEKGLKPKTERQIRYEQRLKNSKLPKEEIESLKDTIFKLNRRRGLSVYDCYRTGLMTRDEIEQKRIMLNDKVLFAANYELSLVSDDELPFPKINNVNKYSSAFFKDAWEVVATIDAAYGGEDSCALSIGAMDWDNNTVVVLGKLYKEALDQNYMQLAELMYGFGVSRLYMEKNTDKGLMGEKFRELGFDAVCYHESQNKHTKIVSTIRPFWRNKGSELTPCVQFVSETDADYLAQIHNYKKGVKHDDAPDNLACLLLRGNFGRLAVRVT